ncbi:MAG TPA: NUDIX hydrolase [Pseudonocardia sp.]|jgi:hypothetical protein|uniref:NUDIX hydrolase n=1 Tax=Pseudonocardia sp. TaxID=60912 RepID=UPI002B4ADC87|nr:NUDIX hydrolase [Pseudonocardia sp.]HLU60531.1 NUDIX hydrolase [Pseudonocardia sp.]
MTLLAWLLVVLAVLLVAAVVVLVTTRARRLDRLHVRIDAARTGLEAACERRANAALAVADVLAGLAGERERAAGVRAAALGVRAERVGDGDREVAENALTRELAAVPRGPLPPDVRAELEEAEQLLVIARRVYNDAVRDTRDLRSRRLVRWLHLAGTAPMPTYFEIADPGPGVTTAAR